MTPPDVSKGSVLNDSSLDMLGGSVLRLLDKYNLLNNQEKIIKTPIAQLIEWKISPTEIEHIKSQPIENEPGFQSLFDYFQQPEKFAQIKFNVQSLDELTEGGIDVGCTTEFYGEAGAGKTQLCMQLALNCALPVELGGLDGMTCYISTEKYFPVRRMNSMAEAIKIKFNIDIPLLDKVLVEEFIENPKELKILIDFWIPRLLKEFPIKLIVIDSIASVFRFNDTDYIKRAQDMREVVHKLNVLANTYNFALVTINHLTSVPQVSGKFTKEVASLGNAWDNLIVAKFKVEKKSSDSSQSHRTLSVDYSPRLLKGKTNFTIASSGIV